MDDPDNCTPNDGVIGLFGAEGLVFSSSACATAHAADSPAAARPALLDLRSPEGATERRGHRTGQSVRRPSARIVIDSTRDRILPASVRARLRVQAGLPER